MVSAPRSGVSRMGARWTISLSTIRIRGTENADAVLLSVSRLNTHCVVEVPMSMPTLSSCSSRIRCSFLPER